LLSRGSRNLTEVQARKSITYQLLNQAACFKAICSINHARDFLSRCLEDSHKVYMIVGFSTLVDSKLQSTFSTRTDSGASVSLELPTSAILGMPGPPLASASFSKDTKKYESFEAEGEYVYAVQFRKITFNRFGNRLESGKISSGHKWTSFLTSDARVLLTPKRGGISTREKLATGKAAGLAAEIPTGVSVTFGALVMKLTIA
jgi:hypothetical protein